MDKKTDLYITVSAQKLDRSYMRIRCKPLLKEEVEFPEYFVHRLLFEYSLFLFSLPIGTPFILRVNKEAFDVLEDLRKSGYPDIDSFSRDTDIFRLADRFLFTEKGFPKIPEKVNVSTSTILSAKLVLILPRTSLFIADEIIIPYPTAVKISFEKLPNNVKCPRGVRAVTENFVS